MAKADGGLRLTLKKYLTPLGFEITPMETGSTSAGVPDMYFRHKETKTTGWIEAKVAKGWQVNLSPHQTGWLLREIAAGGRAYIAVLGQGLGSGGAQHSALWLLDGACAMRVIGPKGLQGLDAADVLGRWEGPPRTWGYGEVGSALTQQNLLRDTRFAYNSSKRVASGG